MTAWSKWLYRGGKPSRTANLINGFSAWLHALGIAPNYMVTLDVVGRRSGRPISVPLVMTLVGDGRYLVSMLGQSASWVQNVRAAGGNAILRHGSRERVRLEEIAVEFRAPVLKAFLQRAPGARPHFPLDKNAALTDFHSIASRYPVFRVTSVTATTPVMR